MNYRIFTTVNFEKEAKKLVKKYVSLKSELAELNKQLLANPFQGIPLGKNAYKIRLAVKSKGKGKSGNRYDAYGDDEKSLLAKYDEEEEKKKEGLRLGSSGEYAKAREEERRQSK